MPPGARPVPENGPSVGSRDPANAAYRCTGSYGVWSSSVLARAISASRAGSSGTGASVAAGDALDVLSVPPPLCQALSGLPGVASLPFRYCRKAAHAADCLGLTASP